MRVKLFYLKNTQIPKDCKQHFYAGYDIENKDVVSSNFDDACLFLSKKAAKRVMKKLKSQYVVQKLLIVKEKIKK